MPLVQWSKRAGNKRWWGAYKHFGDFALHSRENITCHLLGFPLLNFGSIQQEKTQQERASELKPDPLKGRTWCLAFLTGSADLYVPAWEGVMVPPTELH